MKTEHPDAPWWLDAEQPRSLSLLGRFDAAAIFTGWVRFCTIGAEQGLELGQQADGVELSQEAVITETVPQFDDEAADQSGELQTRRRHSDVKKKKTTDHLAHKHGFHWPTVWQKTTSRRYCSDSSMAMVGALSCISRKTMDLLAVSLIMATHSVSVVRRGYSASLHSPAGRRGRGGGAKDG